ncbi:TPA: hypothetical protein N0F65_002009 [Lagenidium giganteum]|uniref:phospholipase D n=1 Tax=Lagenidium giganteum TaxID=4803 RepID=A0AAV2Z0R5_9STRA|nr:TPA: hypothetical protein N0F65_002009 [Lagenidium giganteum]
MLALSDAYIRSLLTDRDLRNSEPLLSFLEVSPSRAMSRYGPSLKEGYVHMRMNGPFQLPLYKCFSPSIETFYRHLYRTWMRVAFVSVVVTFIFPLLLIIITSLPRFFTAQQRRITSGQHTVVNSVTSEAVILGLLSLGVSLFLIVFVYKFFNHRLGVVRRWIVLKPNCFAAYRKRSDREPSEVFLFDRMFTAVKGSYRQGVSWMPSGMVVGSNAGFIEVDTGHYYTRLTMFISLALVCYGVMTTSGQVMYNFESVSMPQGISPSSAPGFVQNMTELKDKLQDQYCGFFFTVPHDRSIRIRANDSHAVTVFQLGFPTNDSVSSSIISFWRGEQVTSYMGVISNNIGANSVVGVAKKYDPAKDSIVASGTTANMPNVGRLTLHGIYGPNLYTLSPSAYYCDIPIQVAVFDWNSVGYYILFLLTGGIIASISGLGLNYLITYIGLWHAQVRRDHWFKCLTRLQRIKRQQKDNRYDSFAPQRYSTLAGEDGCGVASNGVASNEATTKAPNSRPEQPVNSNASSVTFAPGVPAPNAVSWHVDGEDTYEAMFKAISNAKYEVLIAGWWVTPDLYLLRPGRKLPPHAPDDEKKTNKSQLRTLLLSKAQEGVRIYVLIYREVKLALSLNSHYTKRSLMLHPNIRVLRDPIFQIQSLGFWSHHEKIVCVDQSLAFVGGLDICFGRYDHSGHPLSDVGGDKLEDQTWPGKDYSNPITKDFVRVNKPFEDLIDRCSQPRMPWHDVHCSISGPAVQDVAYHFIQRWNFVCSKNDYQLRTGWCICLRSRRFKYLPKCLVPMDFNGWKLLYPSDATRENHSGTLPVACDEVPDEVSCTDEPFQVVANATFLQTSSPESGGRGNSPSGQSDHSAIDVHRPQTRDSMIPIVHPNSRVCNIQVVRSVSLWSAGVHTEASIHTAYLDIISKARHYIYIENQFFISGVDGNGMITNRILQALVDRIERAVKAEETFRVYVVMPLLPAFEGNIRSEELTNLHAVMHWQFATICRGKYSLFEALKAVTDTPENYVSFFGLRKYGIMPNGCVSTEQIYIHSKLLIADDQYVILGSANINDRSMCGDRDSEIAVIIEDVQLEDGWMNDKRYRRGTVASALRMQLFNEHLGLPDDDSSLMDPASEWTWRRIRGISQRNTQIFETVFDCAPANKMQTFSAFKNIEATQIYENERLNVLKVVGPGRHVWDKAYLKEGDYAPWTDVNGVPIQMDRINMDDYVLDNLKDKRRKQLFSMDHDGWCYARNFSVFQEVRTAKTDYRKREKLQHFMTDRLMAQVRRRRYVKKDSGLLPMDRHSLAVSESDEDEHRHFMASVWKRLHRSESNASRTNSFYLSRNAQQPSITSSVVMGDASYPNSPTMSTFRRTTSSPSNDSFYGGRESMPVAGSFRRSSTLGVNATSRSANNTPIRESTDTNHGSIRESTDSAGKLKKWYSFMETPLDFSRRSRFTAEYFDKDASDEFQIHGDEPLLESGRGSFNSVRSYPDNGSELGIGDCQMNHVQTAATVPKENESRARGQLSEIRGHLVEFPLHFLSEEILKPTSLVLQEDHGRWHVHVPQTKDELPFHEHAVISGCLPAQHRQLHCIAARVKPGCRRVLLLPVPPSTQLLEIGEGAVQFAQDVRACFPSLVRRNPMAYPSDSDESDEEDDRDAKANGDPNPKQRKVSTTDSKGPTTDAVSPAVREYLEKTRVKLVESTRMLGTVYDLADEQGLEEALQADRAVPKPFQLLCAELPDAAATSDDSTATAPPLPLTFGLLYVVEMSPKATFLDIPLLRAPSKASTTKSSKDADDDQVYQDANVYSFGTHREATEHGGGKTSDEMVQNIRMRHASGTFCTLVHPTKKWKDVQAHYATTWPEVRQLDGQLRLRKIMGPTPNRPVLLHLER